MIRSITWTAYRKKQADNILYVVDDLHDYYPLTLRQIYYRLVAVHVIENTRSK